MTENLKRQILKVRAAAEANMFDVNAVMAIANREKLYELAIFLSDRENWREYSGFILTGEAPVEKSEEEMAESAGEETVPEHTGRTAEENEGRLQMLFDELVPPVGKANTVAGEIVRAMNRIGYRYYNDGDHVGVGYGRETCNAAARYLGNQADAAVREAVEALWGVRDGGIYHRRLADLETAVLSYLDMHPELKSLPNTEDMFDYTDRDGDVDDGWWDDEW